MSIFITLANIWNIGAGFVNIVGNPNVGKSTLMNALVGERLSIITPKAQTTRHRVLGIVNGDDFQVVFSDTPGMIKPSYALQESMMDFVQSSFQDADVVVYVVDIYQKETSNHFFHEKIKRTEKPLLILINKVDNANQDWMEEKVNFWAKEFPQAEVLPISAIERFNTDLTINKIVSLLPASEPFYPKDTLTDKPERFFVNETIREKILLNYRKEIPYSVEVVTQEFVEEEHLIRIFSEIIVERESQKTIVIGHQGKPLNNIGTQARKDLEKFFGKKIFLKLFVKVDKNWRSNKQQLKKYGYSN